MLIDPFTVGAQIINFLILVWLLRRLLYGPITSAMAAREARIREELDAAASLRADADAEGARYRELTAAFEAEQNARLVEARGELEAWRREHTQAARSEVETMRQRWQQALQQEKDAFLLEVRRRAGHEILDVARRVLHDLADGNIDARIAERFVTEVGTLNPEQRAQVVAAARHDGGRLHVRTAYPVDQASRERLRTGLADVLGPGLSLQFDTSEDLVAGVELRAGGYKVGWAIRDYLQSLEDAMGEVFGDGEESTDARR